MSLYEVLKASKTNRFPDYWTLLWGRKMSASMIKTITGVLPLTFTSKGGNMADWVIYGNDENGTENLVSPIRTANGWKRGYRNYINGDYVPSYTNGEWLYDVFIPINSASFTFWATNVSSPSSTFYFFDSDKQYLPNTAKGTNNYNNVIISNISPDAAYMQFAFRTYCMSEQEIIDNNYQVMLVKGSTAPDHYIPYQQGVGERTKNLFNPNEQIIIGGLTYIGGTYPAGKYRVYNVSNFPCYYKIGESGATGTVNTPNNVYLNAGDIVYVWCSISSNRKICVSEGSTAIPYEPYGYQIPLTVSQQGQTDKSYNIYIGDSPLTEGETVTKTSTGVDIELFEGENTVSTTLYNKPTTEIKYK